MRCVNKVLFLQPKNVKILGGEVEKLTIENAYENVLLKAMGRPITATPKLDYNGQLNSKLKKILQQSIQFTIQNQLLWNKIDR